MNISYKYNFEITYDDLVCSMSSYSYPENMSTDNFMYFMGFPLVPASNGFVVFVRCNWCGQTDGKLENNCCGHCGGWIS